MKPIALLIFAASACFASAQTGPAPAQLPVGVNVLFSPKDDIEAELQELISNAKAEVLVHQYAVTSVPLVRSLIEARDRGVLVVVLLEPNPAIRNYQTPQLLRTAGIVVRLASVKGRDNNRYAIFDGATVATGSYEWTASAKFNSENILVIQEPAIADRYVEHFRSLANSSNAVAPVAAASTSTPSP